MVFSNGLTVRATEISDEFLDPYGTRLLANSIDTEDVTISYYYGKSASITGSTNGRFTFPANWGQDYIWLCAEVRLPEPIEKSQPFDLSYRFYVDDFDDCGIITEETKVVLYNSNYVIKGSTNSSSKVSKGLYADRLQVTFQDLSSSESPISVLRIYLKVDARYDEGFLEGDYIDYSLQKFILTPVSNAGLLGSIIEWIRSIYEGIINLPGKIAEAIGGFFDMVVEAVENLGKSIIDGIKNLFVPSEEDLTRYRDKWDSLLSDRFGALYEVGTIIIDFGEAILNSSRTAKGSVDFPEVSVDLAGANFTFGGWSVNVIPNGFGFLVTAVKTITSIAMVFAFVNGLKKRYDRVMTG